jgi:hypothetical protein
MFDRLTGGARCVLDRFARVGGGFLDRFPSLFDWTLIIRAHHDRCAEQENAKNCEMLSHGNLRVSSYRSTIAALCDFTTGNKKEQPREANASERATMSIWFAKRRFASDILGQASDESTLF